MFAEDRFLTHMGQTCDYIVRKENLGCPDDKLHMGQPWEDYGDYKKYGLSQDDEIFTLWDMKKRELFVYVPKLNKFFSTKSRGYSTHSENDETPETTVFDQEIKPTRGLLASLHYFQENKADWIIQKALNDYNAANEKLKAAEDKCEDLRVNHPRATRQLANAEKEAQRVRFMANQEKREYERILSIYGNN